MRQARGSLLLLPLLLAACTGGSSTPPPPRSVARPAPSPTPYRAASPTPSMPTPAAAPVQGAGAVAWRRSLAEAQAEARASGRVLLVSTTKHDCSICEKFMHDIAPACGARLNQVAVAYVYDITAPESSRLDNALRANLPGAILMPLVGFFTADLGWLNGFAGPRSAQEFMGDIETAARMQPRRSAALRSVSGPAVAQVSFVNEYGETEWSAPADAWPKAVDAVGAQPVLAQVPVAEPSIGPAPVAVSGSDPVAAAGFPAPQPAIGPDVAISSGASAGDPTAGWSPPAPLPAEPTPAPSVPVIAVAPEPVAAPEPAPTVVASEARLPAPLPPIAAPDPSVIAPVAMSESQARESLTQAFDLIRLGQYDRARDALRRISRSLPHTQVGREADRGGVAIYNARRISEASEAERSDLAARARKALSGTMWETLF